MSERFDVVVLGAGSGGESVAWRLAKRGKRVALVERELIGGECTYWACIPSKTLLRPTEIQAEARGGFGVTEPTLDWSATAAYRDYMARGWDDAKQVAEYERMGVTVVKAEGYLDGRGVVRTEDRELLADDIVVATGSQPFIPPIHGLVPSGFLTTRDVTSLHDLPESVAVIGGGPAALELAQMLARFGVGVTMLVREKRLLPSLERRVGETLAETLAADGVELRLGVEVVDVSREVEARRLELANGHAVTAEKVVVATGRVPRTNRLGLDSVGIDAERGIAIDEYGRAGEGLWAVGDVTNVAMFTHVAKYQGRMIVDNILGANRRLRYRAIPKVTFTEPEVATVGLTAEEARRRNLPVRTSTVEMSELGRPYIYETDARGWLTLVARSDTNELLGATAVGPLASEWIHVAVLAVRLRLPADSLYYTMYQFPSYAEAYVLGAEALRNGE